MSTAGPTYLGIAAVAEHLGETQHTIRWWEQQFRQIRPKVTPGRQRRYDRPTVELLEGIRWLVRIERLSIADVRQVLHHQGPAFVRSLASRTAGASAPEVPGSALHLERPSWASLGDP